MIIIEAQEVKEEEPYIWVLLLLQEEVMVADSQAAEVLEAALVASAAVHSVEVVPAVAGSLSNYLSPHSLLFFNGDIASAGIHIAYNKKTGEVRSGQISAPEGFDYYLIKLDGLSLLRTAEYLRK